MTRGSRGGPSGSKRISHSGSAYNLRSAPKPPQRQTRTQGHDRSLPSAKKSAILSVTNACSSVLENLTKKKPPASSLGRPNSSSTPAGEFPRPLELTENITNRSFIPSTHAETPQSSRTRSQRDSTSSTTSSNVTIVERSNEADLYVDESHVYGTTAFEQEVAEEDQASLAFTADEAVRRALTRIHAEEEEVFPNRDEEPLPAPDPQGTAPDMPSQIVVEPEDEIVQDNEDSDTEDEDDEDPMTTREALVEAAETLSSAQRHTSETQLGILKRQEELDLLLQQQARDSVSKEELEAHVKAVSEYMKTVNANASLACENVKLELKKVRAQQEELKKALKGDVAKLNTDMLKMAQYMNGVHKDMDNLATNVENLGTNVGAIANNMESLGKNTKIQTQQLQKTIAECRIYLLTSRPPCVKLCCPKKLIRKPSVQLLATFVMRAVRNINRT